MVAWDRRTRLAPESAISSRNTSDDRYATFFYAIYDCEEKSLTYTNAGHLAPFFVNGDKVQELDEGGTVVGLFEDCPTRRATSKVEPGSLLVAFSDGLTEPENVYGEEFGMERLKEEILRQREYAPAAHRRKSDRCRRTMGRHSRASRRHHRSRRPYGLTFAPMDLRNARAYENIEVYPKSGRTGQLCQ